MQYSQNPDNPQYQTPQYQQGPMYQAAPKRVSTNTPDPHFDLISVLYHALNGAQTYAVYAEDAGREGDQELAQFFVQCQQNQISCAETAKQLLNRRIGQSSVH